MLHILSDEYDGEEYRFGDQAVTMEVEGEDWIYRCGFELDEPQQRGQLYVLRGCVADPRYAAQVLQGRRIS